MAYEVDTENSNLFTDDDINSEIMGLLLLFRENDDSRFEDVLREAIENTPGDVRIILEDGATSGGSSHPVTLRMYMEALNQSDPM